MNPLVRRVAAVGCVVAAAWGCASEPPAPSVESASALASAAPSASAPAAEAPAANGALPLLLDTRPPEVPSEVDPLAATVEALPERFACATLSARGRTLRKLPKRTADAYAQCTKELAADGRDVRGCLLLAELLHEAPRDEVLSDNIATRACARGNGRACRMLAESRLGTGARFDPICAEQMLKTLCADGDAAACFRLGTLELDGNLVPKDAEGGKSRIRKACDGGAYMACLDVVQRENLSDDEKRKLVEGAFASAKKACESEEADACVELATAYVHSGQWYYLATPEKDEAKQTQMLQRACSLGAEDGCSRLDRKDRTDPYKDLCEEEPDSCPATSKDKEVAYGDWIYRRCAAGWSSACTIATRYRRPKSTPEQAKERAAWLEAGCLEGAAGACQVLTIGTLVSTAPADNVLVAGCDLGVASGCVKLAERAEAAGDQAKQLAYLERACPVATPQGGDSVSRGACRKAGLMYKEGRGASKDLQRAAILLQKGCLQNRFVDDGEACVALGTMYEEGIGVPKSMPRALDLYAAGCADEGYNEAVYSRAVSKSRVGGPPPPKKPVVMSPTACERLYKIEPRRPLGVGGPQ